MTTFRLTTFHPPSIILTFSTATYSDTVSVNNCMMYSVSHSLITSIIIGVILLQDHCMFLISNLPCFYSCVNIIHLYDVFIFTFSELFYYHCTYFILDHCMLLREHNTLVSFIPSTYFIIVLILNCIFNNLSWFFCCLNIIHLYVYFSFSPSPSPSIIIGVICLQDHCMSVYSVYFATKSKYDFIRTGMFYSEHFVCFSSTT